jgi:cyclic beta-1,2-glucan synthetase
MSLQPRVRRVSAQGMFANGADALSRVFGGTWLGLRAKLHYSAGSLLRPLSAVSPRTHDDPIRAELFGIQRLEQHAESLAAAQHTTSKPTTDRRLEVRLRGNDRALRTAYHAIIAAARQTRAVTPAAEWLLDNFHLV